MRPIKTTTLRRNGAAERVEASCQSRPLTTWTRRRIAWTDGSQTNCWPWLREHARLRRHSRRATDNFEAALSREDYLSNYRCWRCCLTNTLVHDELLNSGLRNLASRNYRHRFMVCCRAHFDICNRSEVTHVSVGQTFWQRGQTVYHESAARAVLEDEYDLSHIELEARSDELADVVVVQFLHLKHRQHDHNLLSSYTSSQHIAVRSSSRHSWLIDWVRQRPTKHIIGHIGYGFLRVKWPNHQCQSTERTHKTKLNQIEQNTRIHLN